MPSKPSTPRRDGGTPALSSSEPGKPAAAGAMPGEHSSIVMTPGHVTGEHSLDEAIPRPLFLDFLRRLHEGPPQQAAALRVALAVWEGAAARGDSAQAREALQLVRDALEQLQASLSELQEAGRQLAARKAE